MSRVQNVSIRDLAARSGFSPMTVSRALRGLANVDPKTKAKILSLAEELNYASNPLVRANMTAIRSRRSSAHLATIAILHYTPPGGHWAITRNIIDGAVSRAKQSGFTCDHFDLAQPDIARSQLSRVLFNRGIHGVIQTPMASSLDSFPLDLSQLTLVSCDPGSLPQKLHRVCPDYYGNMDMLLKRVRKSGYERIGLLFAADHDHRLNHLMTSRYLAFQQTERLPKIPIHMPDTRDAYEPSSLRRWYQEHRPEIIIATADTNFRDKLFENAGIPPQAVIVKANINHLRPGISGISEESREVGETAVNTLAQLLFQNQRGLPEKPISVLVPGKWHDAPDAPVRL